MKKYILLLFLILLSCSEEGEFSNMNTKNNNPQINAADIKKLASKKIYFGHQSVGYNIIDAIKTQTPSDSGLIITETCNPQDFKKPLFAHSQNGENFKPESKIASFAQKMDSGLGDKVDIAFFKFCYVDVTAGTDVVKLFTEYKNTMNLLIKKYPKTKFLHVTVPVTSEKSNGLKNQIKYFIKKLTGNKTGEIYDNINRMKFNDLLRKEYGEKVFNLASIESSDNSGNEIVSEKGGIKHQILLPQYTNDGGHLNYEGGRIVALKIIQFINNQIN